MRTGHVHTLSAVAAAVVLALSYRYAAADAVVSGTRERMILQANEATVPEVLDALRSVIHVDIDLQGASERKLSGRYVGSVQQVLSRVLRGEDYVLHLATDKISIRLLGAGGSGPASPSSGMGAVAAYQGSRLVALRNGTLKRTGDTP